MISKKIKKLVMGVTVSMMFFSTLTTGVQAKGINKTFLKTQSIGAIGETDSEYTNGCCIDLTPIEMITYEEFIKEMGIELEKEDDVKLEGLYNKAISLQKEGKTEAEDNVWDDIYEILDNYIDELEMCPECEECIDEEIGEATGEATEDMGKLIASYEVKNNQIEIKTVEGNKKLSKDDTEKHKIMWERAKQIIPKAYLSRINKYDVVTDGKDNLMAYVNADDSNKVWTFALDINDAFDKNGKLIDKDLNETIVHEFGHILTLNHEQIVPEYNENSTTYATEEGTTKKDSYLNKFYQKFWSKIYDDYEKLSVTENDEEDEQENLAFYEKYKNQFVSDYASTNPEEDIAESFRVFVLENKPSGKTIAEEKILFFYNFPELIKIREEIRNNLNLK